MKWLRWNRTRGRELGGWRSLDWLWQDVRFGLRALSRDRGFSLTAVLTLALGIGSATAIFSVIDNVLLAPFPYRDGQNIFCPEIHEVGTSRIDNGMTVPEFVDFQQQNHVFADSMGVTEESVLLKEPGQLKEFDADRLTGPSFQFLGMPALLGRGLLPSDAVPGAPPVFVLNYRVWKDDFNSDPSLIGKTFTLDGIPTTLVGVMPSRFSFWDGNLWRPLILDPADKEHRIVMYGHLRRGLSPKAAAAEWTALATRLAKVYPHEFPKRFNVDLASLIDETVRGYRETLYTLVGAVGLLLLIACANVSNLLLARATAREKELAIRISLGSGRVRVIRQLLIESILLALAGAAMGCLFAWAGLRGLMAIVPMWTFPDEAVVAENIPVLLVTIGVAVLTGILFGLAPALTASRGDVNEILKSGGRGNSGFRRGRLRNLLIVGEVALSLVLLVSSGLLMRSFVQQRRVDLGIRTDHLLTTQINLPARQYTGSAAQARFLRELLRRLEADPRVVSAGVATEIPPYSVLNTDFDVSGVPHSERWSAHMAACSWQWFSTVGSRLLAGRLPAEADENGARRVVVINQTMASQYFGRQNPIGQHLQLTALKTAADPIANPWFEIVGVVSDIKNEGTQKNVWPEVYLPYTIEGFGGYRVFLRTAGKPEAMVPALTTTVLAMDRTVIPQYVWTMDRFLEIGEYSRPRFFMILLAVFAMIGLTLVSVGVYSVISYTVSQQRHEIGIRMALGATPGAVRSQVVTSALRFVYTGAAAGIALTLLLSRVISSQVWGVAWYDPVTLAAVLILLTFVGFLAAYAPSVRASRVSPMVCLRDE
jgi:putative ABC transport system permease protein